MRNKFGVLLAEAMAAQKRCQVSATLFALKLFLRRG
jgi:hypothetical protein